LKLGKEEHIHSGQNTRNLCLTDRAFGCFQFVVTSETALAFFTHNTIEKEWFGVLILVTYGTFLHCSFFFFPANYYIIGFQQMCKNVFITVPTYFFNINNELSPISHLFVTETANVRILS